MRRILALLLLSFLAAACRTPADITQRAMRYNEGVANAINKLVLLNAVRASERFPRVYTEIASSNETAQRNQQGTMTLPIGPGVASPSDYDLGVTLNHNDSSTMTVNTLLDGEAIKAIMRPVGLTMVNYFIEGGWSPEVIYMMMIDKITISSGLGKKLLANAYEHCNPSPSAKGKQQPKSEWKPTFCQHLTFSADSGGPCFEAKVKIEGEPMPVSVCHKPEEEPSNNEGGSPKHSFDNNGDSKRGHTFSNDGDSKVDFEEFRLLLRLMLLADFRLESTSKRACTALMPLTTAKDVALLLKAAKDTERSIRLPEQLCPDTRKEDIRKKVPANHYALEETDTKRRLVIFKDGELPDITFRSPDGMIYYLGELIRAQNSPKKGEADRRGFDPTFIYDEDEKKLFDVRRTSILHKKKPLFAEAVSVNFRGKHYFIPADQPIESLHTLSLISYLFALNRGQVKGVSVFNVIGTGS